MKRILIIKLGAMGDVLRTTAILRELRGEITWLTREESIPLLGRNPYITAVIPPEKCAEITHRGFDLVLNLDDDNEAAQIASEVKKSLLVGAYMDNDQIRYTHRASKWFDMGLISKYGLAYANELKRLNKKTYQEFLFEMLGLEFRGQEYLIPRPKKPKNAASNNKTIGIEKRAGARWQLKKWDKFDALVQLLEISGHTVKIFQHRNNVLDYINDINQCDIIVTGDTLCMHIGIALRKDTIAIFGPTSADEIYDYGRVHKIVSPLDCIKCYKRKCAYKPNCMQSISLNMVYERINNLLLAAK
jgi:heptosyltransferase-2